MLISAIINEEILYFDARLDEIAKHIARALKFINSFKPRYDTVVN